MFQSKNMAFACLLLLSIWVSGCKPRQQGNPGSESAEKPQTRSDFRFFRKAPESDTPPNFNRDFHVIRTLWNDLAKYPQQDARRGLLLENLRIKTAEFEAANAVITAEQQTLLNQIKDSVQK